MPRRDGDRETLVTSDDMTHTAYIGLGSNVGDRRRAIESAAAALREEPGILDVQLSSLHETEPVGGPAGQGRFLNAAARVRTTLEPAGLLARMLAIETALGRQRGPKWGPRTIDLDLLLYDDRIIDEPGLTVPHPRMHERWFVLAPLSEIAREAVHPRLGKTVGALLDGADLDPRFMTMIERAREDMRAGRVYTEEEVRKRFGLT